MMLNIEPGTWVKRPALAWLSLRSRLREDPFARTCMLFAALKLFYLIAGFFHDLHVQSFEDLARMFFSFQFRGFQPLWHDVPWLPLPPIIQSIPYIFHVAPWFLGSAFQTLISTAGAMVAGMLARDLADGDWRAGTGVLAAWGGSEVLSIMGIGYLSEPLFHLQILLLLLAVLRWMKSGGRGWFRAVLVLLCAINLSRYEGWILTAALFGLMLIVLWDSRRQGLWRDWRGLWGVRWRDILLLAGGIVSMPLLWMGLNWLLRGDPLFFKKATDAAFLENVEPTLLRMLSFYLEYLEEAWRAQPVAIILGLAVLFVPGVMRGPAFIIVFTICVITLSNYKFITSGSTAFSYPERLSSTLFVTMTPLFGLACFHLGRRLDRRWGKRPSKLVLYFMFAVMIATGLVGFTTRPSVLREEMGKDMVDDLHALLKKETGEPPRVLVEGTKSDYSVVLLYVGVHESEYVFFTRRPRYDPRDFLLIQNPSIRYLLLNHGAENDRWLRVLGNCHLIGLGPMWNLYEYDRPRRPQSAHP